MTLYGVLWGTFAETSSGIMLRCARHHHADGGCLRFTSRAGPTGGPHGGLVGDLMGSLAGSLHCSLVVLSGVLY